MFQEFCDMNITEKKSVVMAEIITAEDGKRQYVHTNVEDINEWLNEGWTLVEIVELQDADRLGVRRIVWDMERNDY